MPKKATPIQPTATPKTSNPWRSTLLYLLLVFFALFPWLRLGGFAYSMPMQFVIVGLLCLPLALLTGLGLLLGKLSWPSSRFFWPVAAYLLVMVLAGAVSTSPYRSLVGAYGFNADGLAFFLACLLIGFSVLTLDLREGEVGLFVRVLVFQAAVLSLQTLYEARGGIRPETPLYNSDFFLSYGLLVLPLAVGQTVQFLRRKGWLASAAALVAALLIGSAVYLTLPATLQTLLVGRDSPSRSAPTQASPSPTPTPESFATSDSNNQRFTLWKLGWQAGTQRPLLGWGPGTVRSSFYGNAAYLASWNFLSAPNSYHNDLLDRFAQTGSLGVLTYCVMILGLYAAYLRRRPPPGTSRLLGDSVLAGITLFLIFNLALFTTIQTGICLWLFAGLLISATDGVGRRRLQFKPLLLLPALGLAVGVSGLALYCLRLQSAETQAGEAFAYLGQRRDVGTASLLYRKAALTLPDEDYYWRESGATAFYAAASLSGKPAAAPFAAQALADSRKAVDLAPLIPIDRISYGEILYVLSPAGSSAEQEGLRQLGEGQRQTPYDQINYQGVAQAFQLKNQGSPLTLAQHAVLYDNLPARLVPSVDQLLKDLHVPNP